MQELIASSLAQTDALTKLLIEKGLITSGEFMQKLSAERASYVDKPRDYCIFSKSKGIKSTFRKARLRPSPC